MLFRSPKTIQQIKVEYLIRNKKGKFKEKEIDTNILKVQEKIEKTLGLKVNILNKKNNSGKVTIEYKSFLFEKKSWSWHC